MACKLAAMEASAAERCKKTIVEMIVMSENPVALAAPASGTSQVKCYVCLEDIERDEPAAHLCDQQSHAIHVECCRGILSAAGTDTGDGYHRFSRTATCGCCRQRRDGDVFAPLPQPMAVAESGASALQVQAVATGYAPAAPVPTTALLPSLSGPGLVGPGLVDGQPSAWRLGALPPRLDAASEFQRIEEQVRRDALAFRAGLVYAGQGTWQQLEVSHGVSGLEEQLGPHGACEGWGPMGLEEQVRPGQATATAGALAAAAEPPPAAPVPPSQPSPMSSPTSSPTPSVEDFGTDSGDARRVRQRRLSHEDVSSAGQEGEVEAVEMEEAVEAEDAVEEAAAEPAMPAEPPAADTPPLPPMLPSASDTPPDVPPIGSPSPSAEHHGDGAPTDEQAVAEVVSMGFEHSLVESTARRFRRAQQTKRDVLGVSTLTDLVLQQSHGM